MDRTRSILLFDAIYDQMLDYDTIINNITKHIQYYSLKQPDLDIKHLLQLYLSYDYEFRGWRPNNNKKIKIKI